MEISIASYSLSFNRTVISYIFSESSFSDLSNAGLHTVVHARVRAVFTKMHFLLLFYKEIFHIEVLQHNNDFKVNVRKHSELSFDALFTKIGQRAAEKSHSNTTLILCVQCAVRLSSLLRVPLAKHRYHIFPLYCCYRYAVL